jgi:hypothetical protein
MAVLVLYRKSHWFAVGIFFIAAVVSFSFQARTAFFCTAIMGFSYASLVYGFRPRLLIIFASLFLLVTIKKDSTSGRVFIVKNTWKIIQNNPNGVGLGKFKVHYNLQQAEYFRVHPIDDRVALLADDTEFACNEFLQLMAEAGWGIGILFICGNIAVVGWAVKKYLQKRNLHLLFCIIGIFGILAGSATFYLLHNWWMLSFYLLCIAGILLYRKPRILKVTGIPFIGIAIILLLIGSFNEHKSKRCLLAAVQMSINGYAQYADSLFNLECATKNIRFLHEFGAHKLRYSQFDNALQYLLEAKKQVSNHQLYSLIGNAYLGKREFRTAEYYYLCSVFMAPNRFGSRFKLADLYRTINDTASEKYWLNSILHLPEKIPSKLTQIIKNRATIRLLEFER